LFIEVRNVIGSFTELAEQKKINLVSGIQVNTQIEADRHMLNTIFRNLISNAIKFTPKGGTIILHSSINEDGKSVRFSITDSGIGMDKKMIEDLFKINVDSKRPGTEGELSSGFGLNLSRGFIQKHGSDLSVESEEGKGSTFSFILPLYQ